jgi:hypothetical protein
MISISCSMAIWRITSRARKATCPVTTFFRYFGIQIRYTLRSVLVWEPSWKCRIATDYNLCFACRREVSTIPDRDTEYRVPKYWPENAGRIRYWMPNLAMAKQFSARADAAIAAGTWPDLKAESEGIRPKSETVRSFSVRFLETRCKPRMRTWDDYERS